MELPAAHAEISYPGTPSPLRALLYDALDRIPPIDCADRLPVLIAPHIDLRVDLTTYAAAFRALLDRPCFPETVFILGVGHRCPHEFSLASASFLTPLGNVQADEEVISSIRGSLKFETARGLEGWSGEHSLEFPLLWLQAIRDRAFPGSPFRVVPILLSGLWPWIMRGQLPGSRTQVAQFGRAVMRAAHRCSNAAIIVSIDGCHVGPRFGHPFSGDSVRNRVQAWEKKLWSLCATPTLPEWFSHLATIRNAAYFDGVGALHLVLQNCHRKARVLKNRLWYEHADQSLVTFTGGLLESIAPHHPSKNRT